MSLRLTRFRVKILLNLTSYISSSANISTFAFRMKSSTSKVEITAPVGSWESLRAAIQAGADSVYFGIGILNMRARSSVNFNLRNLVKIAGICRKNNVLSYLTLNTVIYDGEMKEMRRIIDSARKTGSPLLLLPTRP